MLDAGCCLLDDRVRRIAGSTNNTPGQCLVGSDKSASSNTNPTCVRVPVRARQPDLVVPAASKVVDAKRSRQEQTMECVRSLQAQCVSHYELESKATSLLTNYRTTQAQAQAQQAQTPSTRRSHEEEETALESTRAPLSRAMC
jgi:hypothetical protein